MAREPKPIRSDIVWSAPDSITVRGHDLAGEILGHMAWPTSRSCSSPAAAPRRPC